MRRRRLGGLLRPRQGLLDFVELGLAFDREQGDLAAATRLALESPAASRVKTRRRRDDQRWNHLATTELESSSLGLFAVQLVKRLRENRNTLEHSVPHLSHDSRYLGLIVKPDRRGLSVLYTVPMHQLTRLVDSMRTAESWMRLLSVALYSIENDDGLRHNNGPTEGEAWAFAFSKAEKPHLPDKISPSELEQPAKRNRSRRKSSSPK